MKKRSGVSVPLLSLRKKEGSLCGEFSDLVSLGVFCKRAKIDIIQILPVNDSGTDSSPYGALSAFALHPVYIDIAELSCAPSFSAGFKKEYQAVVKKFADAKRVDFSAILSTKTELLKKIYAQEENNIWRDAQITKWQNENDWVNVYALYKVLKEKHNLKSWRDWEPEFQTPDKKNLAAWQKTFLPQIRFYVWLQYELFFQFQSACKKLQELDVSLKGDLPILMNEDSVDVWLHRELFDLTRHAGAPPDMLAQDGQNWGFPVYAWEKHKLDNYHWWKERLRIAENFYRYIRIDHVLGFFRIWNIPAQENLGISGYFFPFIFITDKDLMQLAFSPERISWLSKAHIPQNEILQIDPSFSQSWIKKFLCRIGDEDLFLFLPQVSEQDIQAEKLLPAVEEVLLNWYHNRALISVGKGLYFPHWNLQSSRAFLSLHDIEKEVFLDMIKRRYKKSEELWEKAGKEILSQLQRSSKLFFCAEDLGAVPACVPKVMSELSIYGLRIERWSRHYESDLSFFLPQEYPRESVMTVSVHDTSTLRDWWQNEGEESLAFYNSFIEDAKTELKKLHPPKSGDAQAEEKQTQAIEKIIKEKFSSYSSELSASLLFQILRRQVERGNSQIVIFQIQELLDLEDSLRSANPMQDRVNVPGSCNSFNWSYRLPLSIEELSLKKTWVQTVQKLFA